MGIQLGIVGYGGMGGFHHRNASKIEGVQVVGAYDIDPVRVQVAEESGLRGFSSLEDLLACEDINTVLVAVPNDCHMEICIAASNAGKHVICEKPFTVHVDELKELIALAKQHNVMLLEAITNQYYPNYLELKKQLSKAKEELKVKEADKKDEEPKKEEPKKDPANENTSNGSANGGNNNGTSTPGSGNNGSTNTPSRTTTASGNNNSVNAVKTGDTTNVAGLVVLCLAAVVVMVMVKKKRAH